MITRRAFAGALGLGSLWAMAGCARPVSSTVRPASEAWAEAAVMLRAALGQLAGHGQVTARAVQHQHWRAGVDPFGSAQAWHTVTGLALQIQRPDGRIVRVVGDDLRAQTVARLVDELGARPGAAPEAHVERVLGSAADFATLQRAELPQALVARLAGMTPSQVVYQAAWLDVDAIETLDLSATATVRQHLVRQRVEVAVGTWGGRSPTVGRLANGLSGAALLSVPDEAALAAMIARVDAPTTPSAPAAAEREVVLTPSVVATALDALVAVGAPLPAGVATRGARDGYGRAWLDDDGRELTQLGPEDAPVVRDGGFAARVRGVHPGLVMTPGRGTQDGLAEGLADGWVIDGASTFAIDPGEETLRILAGRARVFRAGRPTGHVYRGVELRASRAAWSAVFADRAAERTDISRRHTSPTWAQAHLLAAIRGRVWGQVVGVVPWT